MAFESAAFFARRHFPEMHSVGCAAGSQQLAVRRKNQVDHPSQASLRLANRLAASYIPKMNRPGAPAADQQFAVWRKRDRLHLVILRDEQSNLFAGGHIPQTDGVILAGGGE